MNISVIIPCYNVEKYIPQTIQSLLNQKDKNFEIICINDGSTDNTLEILKKYQRNDNRIKVHNKKNGGVSSARNLGILKSTGDYIFFLDGDDIVENNFIEIVNNIIKANEHIDFISFGYQIKQDNKIKNIFSNKKFDNTTFKQYELLNLFLTKKIRQSMCSFIVKKELVKSKNINFDVNTTNGEDQEFQIKCMYHSKESYYISKTLFIYMQRENSAVNNVGINYLTLLDVFQRLLKYIDKKENKELYENLKIYSLFVYFYTLKNVSKKSNDELLKLVLTRYKYFKYPINIKISSFSIQTYLLNILFKISPKLVITLLKKVSQ